jgi:hypothetical protein
VTYPSKMQWNDKEKFEEVLYWHLPPTQGGHSRDAITVPPVPFVPYLWEALWYRKGKARRHYLSGKFYDLELQGPKVWIGRLVESDAVFSDTKFDLTEGVVTFRTLDGVLRILQKGDLLEIMEGSDEGNGIQIIHNPQGGSSCDFL